MKDTSFSRRKFQTEIQIHSCIFRAGDCICSDSGTQYQHRKCAYSVPKILRILFLRDGAATEYSIIWRIRLPRILMAAMLGGALSLSGFLLQTFFANPIAGPFVLGISSGAKWS